MSFTLSGSTITQANEAGKSITAVASITGGITVTCASHGYANGDYVQITGTTNYNGFWEVSSVTTNTFRVVYGGVSGLNGQTITYVSDQTGTVARGDKNLAGLSAIAGVTTTTEYSGNTVRYVYDIGSLILQYNSLKINPVYETLVLGSSSPNNSFIPQNTTSHLIIGTNLVKNGARIISSHPAIVSHKQPADVYDIFANYRANIFLNKGTLHWWEGIIRTNKSLWFGNNAGYNSTTVTNLNAGSFIAEGAVIEAYGTPTYTEQAMQIVCDSQNLTIDGLVARGLSVNTNPCFTERYHPTVNGLTLRGCFGITITTILSTFITYKNYASSGSSKDLNIFRAGKLRGTNCEKGSATIIVEHNTSAADANGVVEITKEWKAVVKDTTGANVQGAKYFIRDTDNGDRRDALSQTYTTDKTYTGSTDANGSTGIVDVLTAVVAKSSATLVGVDDSGLNKKDRRSKYDNTNDSFDILFGDYTKLFSVTERDLKGTGVLEFNWSLFNDLGITETNQTTVGAYTGFAHSYATGVLTMTLSSAHTFAQTYDFNKLYEVTNMGNVWANGKVGFITSSDGSNYALHDNTVIVGAQYIDFGEKRLSGGKIRYSATGTYSPKLGATTIDFSQAGTYNFADADFTGQITLTNSSGGNVTVELSAGVDYVNTGPNITIDEPQIYQSATISGLGAGTRIQLYDTTNDIELYNGTPTFPYTWTDSTPYAADVTIRLRAALVSGTTAKEFIEATIGTATLASPAISYLANQVNDAVYNANAVNGSTVTGITFTDAATDIVNINISAGSVTLQSIYAAFAYWMFTETGIADDIAYVQAVDPANYRFTSMKIKNTSSPTVPLEITGGYAVDNTTGASIDLVDTTGGTLVFAPDHVVNNIVTVGGSNIITGDIDDVTAKVQAGMTAQGYTTTRAPKLDNLDAAISTVGGATAEEVADEIMTRGLATEANATKNKNAIMGEL